MDARTARPRESESKEQRIHAGIIPRDQIYAPFRLCPERVLKCDYPCPCHPYGLRIILMQINQNEAEILSPIRRTVARETVGVLLRS